MTKLEELISRSVEGDTLRSATFRNLLQALVGPAPFDIASLYDLPYEDFELTIETLREWRLQRYVYDAVDFEPHPPLRGTTQTISD